VSLLKSGLNKEFYKWVDDVKKAIRHKKELEDKLEYFESRLTGYQAVVYDSIGSSSSRNNVEDNLLYVIGKIDAVNDQMKEVRMRINEYIVFKSKLSGKTNLLLEYLIESNLQQSIISLNLNLSKSRFYQIVNELSRKYDSI